MLQIIAYIFAVGIGFLLGLFGGGGSILAVPVLAYLVRMENSVQITAYSLFIVGSSSLIGFFQNLRNQLVDWPAAVYFGIPSMLSIRFIRSYVLARIPDVIHIANFSISKNTFILLFFSVTMMVVSILMIRPSKMESKTEGKAAIIPLIILGLLTGVLAGFVGAGGGFLIVPALVLFGKLPIKKAIGTSLLIISLNSLIGFTGDLSAGTQIDWKFLLSFTALAIVGIFLGNFFQKKIASQRLKPYFGWFVLIIGVLMFCMEIFIKK